MKLNQFLRNATKSEKYAVATVCSDSVDHLYQLAGGHCFASPKLAMHIERLTRRVAQASGGRLEAVPRASLVRYPEIFVPDAPDEPVE